MTVEPDAGTTRYPHTHDIGTPWHIDPDPVVSRNIIDRNHQLVAWIDPELAPTTLQRLLVSEAMFRLIYRLFKSEGPYIQARRPSDYDTMHRLIQDYSIPEHREVFLAEPTYAHVMWTIDDLSGEYVEWVKTKDDMSDDDKHGFFIKHESEIQDTMTRAGWDAIYEYLVQDDLLDPDTPDQEDNDADSINR